MKNSAKYCSKKTNRIKCLYFVGFLCFGIAVVTGLTLGSTRLSFSELLRAFTEGFDASAGTRIFAYVRLPRTVAALVCGAALAVSGAVIQGVLANQLASPSVIGVNAGAGVAVESGSSRTPVSSMPPSVIVPVLPFRLSRNWASQRHFQTIASKRSIRREILSLA